MSSTSEGTGPVAQEGTGAGLIAFLNWTIDKSELVDATASALRTGCQKVLSIEDDPNGLDLRSADISAIISRFRNKHRLDMKPRTLEQYEQRFRQSVEMYLKWLDDDPTWKPTQRKRVSNGSGSKLSKDATRATSAPAESMPTIEQPQPGMIKYPFPIRPGLQGTITLPEDLSVREAKRIAAFVSTLALEDAPELSRALPAGQWNHSDSEA